MLKRLYVDNFRCLVNFELNLDRVSLLLGENGSGKTTVFDVLYRLQQFLAGNAKVLALFPSTELTRWQTNGAQRFELNLSAEKDEYRYTLVIEHDEERRKAKVKTETLELGGKKLFDFKDGMAQLYHDNFRPGPEYPFDWTQSGISVLQSRPDNKKLTRFRKELAKIIVAFADPLRMSSESRREDSALSRYMENFASWYRYVSQEHQGAMVELFSELKQVLPGFQSFSVKEAGEARVLKVLMERPDGGGRPLSYDFSELSDGQRVLIALYTLLCGLRDEGVSLFLDEPDNYLSLREIQPWLTALTDAAGKGIEQVVLISHHPEIIDYLASESGRWFAREGNGPIRVSDRPKARVDGLKVSKTLARGWES